MFIFRQAGYRVALKNCRQQLDGRCWLPSRRIRIAAAEGGGRRRCRHKRPAMAELGPLNPFWMPPPPPSWLPPPSSAPSSPSHTPAGEEISQKRRRSSGVKGEGLRWEEQWEGSLSAPLQGQAMPSGIPP